MTTFREGLVSIVTPVYNAERFVGETIQSVLNQTYPHWELILVNDCTPDNSVEVIESYQSDERIRLIHLEHNSGAAVARNTGIEAAHGQYIAFIDSDDYWEPEKLERQLDFMNQHQVGFTYTNFAIMAEDGTITKPRVWLPQQLNYEQFLKNTAIACSTVVIDRHMIGDFRMPNVRKGQDSGTWMMLMRERGVTAYAVDSVLNRYRIVHNSLSNNKFGALKRHWNNLRRLEKLSLPKTLYVFVHYIFQALRRRL